MYMLIWTKINNFLKRYEISLTVKPWCPISAETLLASDDFFASKGPFSSAPSRLPWSLGVALYSCTYDQHSVNSVGLEERTWGSLKKWSGAFDRCRKGGELDQTCWCRKISDYKFKRENKDARFGVVDFYLCVLRKQRGIGRWDPWTGCFKFYLCISWRGWLLYHRKKSVLSGSLM